MNTDRIWAEAIAKEYAPRDDSKIIALKKLDNQAKLPAVVFAYTLGIASSLVAGLGMCLAMGVIGGGTSMGVLGILLGLLGFAGWGINYPIYQRRLKKGKEKYAYEIMELAREISEQ